jgi:sugar/nucleoside kinase (ribokinase family)
VMAEVIVAGHICLDIIPRFLSESALQPGALIEVGAADLSTGGCVSNVGRALHRLGVEVSLVGKVGDDAFGQIVCDLLTAESPDLAEGLVVSEGGSTSYSVVINPPDRDRTFLHMPGENNTFSSSDVPASALESAKILHFGYPPLMARMYADEGAELETLFRRAKHTGVITSLDLSLPDPSSASGRAPWKRILERVLPITDLFFPSESELAFMLGLQPDQSEAMIQQCLKMGAGVAVLKRGDRGLSAGAASLPLGPDQVAHHPCFKVQACGTTGAGDATIAGFLMGYLRGFDLQRCLEAGCAVGASSVEAYDAVSGVRPWSETQARIRAGWDTLKP